MSELEKNITEIFVTSGGQRHRVYRGRNRQHIEWKLAHHAGHGELEIVERIYDAGEEPAIEEADPPADDELI